MAWFTSVHMIHNSTLHGETLCYLIYLGPISQHYHTALPITSLFIFHFFCQLSIICVVVYTREGLIWQLQLFCKYMNFVEKDFPQKQYSSYFHVQHD